MHRHQQAGAAAPGLAAPELAHQDHVDLAPLGTTKALPDVGASNDEALAGGAAQGSRGQKKADASIVPDTDAADKARHPLSAAFGDMPAEEFDELVRDIKRNGLITTITAAEDGTILDGRVRTKPAKPKTKAPTPPGPRGPGARNIVVVDGVEVLDPGHARPAAHKPFFDLCGIPADDFKLAATVQGVMRGFAEFCGEHDPVHVAHALQQHEVQAMREWVSTVRAWLDVFANDLGAEVSE